MNFLVCNVCGKLFLSQESRKLLYCSRKCFHISRILKKEITCFYCGKAFTRKPSTIKEKNFCSRACRGLYEKKYESNTKKVQAYRQRYPERYKAHSIVTNAIYAGILKKQPCKVCGDAIVEAHHKDYSKPLEVEWLCNLHHSMFGSHI